MAAVATRMGRSHAELDEVSLRLAKQGDRAAQRRFINHYASAVFHFLSRMGLRSAVEDAAQETMVAAIRALPRFDPAGPASLSTWLLTIASRIARRCRPRPIETLALEPTAPDASPEEHIHAAGLAARARAVVDALDPAVRETFVLAEAHGLTSAEIAEVQSVPAATARTRLHRARTRIRTALKEVQS